MASPSIKITEQVFPNPVLTASKGLIAVMIGTASKGEFDTFNVISSWDSFISTYGEPISTSYLGFAIKKYLPWSPNILVARVGSTSSPATYSTATMIEESGSEELATMQAKTKGTWGNLITVKITKTSTSGTHKYAVEVFYDGNSVEKYLNVDLDIFSENFIETRINDSSSYIEFDCEDTGLSGTEDLITSSSTTFTLSGGTDGDTGADIASNIADLIEVLKDKDAYVFDLIIVPNYGFDATVISALDDLVTTRNDCFAPIDPPYTLYTYNGDPVQSAVDFSNGAIDVEGYRSIYMDNKNLGFFAFWQKDYDSDSQTYVWMPPSIYVAATLAKMESLSSRWESVAGLNNGRIGTVDVQYSPTKDDRDLLYGEQLNGEIRVVNPIPKFTVEGITIWGQRTTERSNLPTNRINVVMMLNYLKQQLYFLGKRLQFRLTFPGSDMWRDFTNGATSICNYIQSKSGCEGYTIVDPANTNPPEVRANNKFIGKLSITPTNVAEDIEFVIQVTPAGVTVA